MCVAERLSKVGLNRRLGLGRLLSWPNGPQSHFSVYAPPPFPRHRHAIMVRGKRTGAIPATVFFEEEPITGLEIIEYATPSIRTFSSPCTLLLTHLPLKHFLFASTLPLLTNLRHFQARQTRDYVEQIKQGAKKLQNAQREALEQIRERKRDLEYSAFRDEQRAKLDAVDAYLETAKAELESTKSHMDVDASTAPSSLPHATSRSADSTAAPSGLSIGASAVVESMSGMSAMEKATMTHRLKTSQIRLELLARKERDEKVNTVFEALPHLTEEEVNTGLRLLGEDEFDVIEEYERFPELRGLRHTIARQYTDEARKVRPKAKRSSRGTSKAAESGDVPPAKATTSSKAKRGSAKSSTAKTVAAATLMNSSSSPAPQASPRLPLAPQHQDDPNLNSSSAPGSNVRDPQLEAIAALLPQGVDLTESRMGLSASGSNNGSKYEETESDGAEDGYDSDGAGGDDFATRTHKKKKQVTVKKLKLDDAIAQGSMEGWSTARVRAWNLRHENPNAYYYRFNHPGEVQRNGKWTDEEREIFLNRMQEVGVNGQWGIFAKEVYGRVGYQCANFYRQMIENAEIEDPRYVIDENGKAHFLFSKRKGRSSSSTPSDATPQSNSPSGTGDDEMEEGEMQLDGLTKVTRDGRDIYIPKINVPVRRTSNAAAPSASSKPRSSAKSVTAIDPFLGAGSAAVERALTPSASSSAAGSGAGASTSKSGGSSSRGGASSSAAASGDAKTKKKTMKKRKRDVDGGDEDYKPSSTWARERADREAVAAQKNRMDSNPLPGFLDVITNNELIEPAISPYGHVLSYSTWLKCLSAEPKNTCPFTKKLIKKRDLIILTWENVDRYRDKIDRSGQQREA